MDTSPTPAVVTIGDEVEGENVADVRTVRLRMHCPACGEAAEGRPVWAPGQRSFTCACCGSGIGPGAVTILRSPSLDTFALTRIWEELRRNAEFPVATGETRLPGATGDA